MRWELIDCNSSFLYFLQNEKNDVKVEPESAKKVKEKDGETKEKEDELKTMVVDQPDEDFQTNKSSPKQGDVWLD